MESNIQSKSEERREKIENIILEIAASIYVLAIIVGCFLIVFGSKR